MLDWWKKSNFFDMKLDLTSNIQRRVVEEAIGMRWEWSGGIKLTVPFRKSNLSRGMWRGSHRCEAEVVHNRKRFLTFAKPALFEVKQYKLQRSNCSRRSIYINRSCSDYGLYSTFWLFSGCNKVGFILKKFLFMNWWRPSSAKSTRPV